MNKIIIQFIKDIKEKKLNSGGGGGVKQIATVSGSKVYLKTLKLAIRN